MVIALDGVEWLLQASWGRDPHLLRMNGFDEIEDQLVASAQLSDSRAAHSSLRPSRIVFPRLVTRVRNSIGLWMGWFTRGDTAATAGSQPQAVMPTISSRCINGGDLTFNFLWSSQRTWIAGRPQRFRGGRVSVIFVKA